jgi:hypothetical protein
MRLFIAISLRPMPIAAREKLWGCRRDTKAVSNPNATVSHPNGYRHR